MKRKRKYNERVLNVERGSFTPAVFLTTGEMLPECKRLVNKLAELYAIKEKNRYQVVVRYICTKIRFALLRSCLVALRGFRGKVGNDISVARNVSFGLIPDNPIAESTITRYKLASLSCIYKKHIELPLSLMKHKIILQ